MRAVWLGLAVTLGLWVLWWPLGVLWTLVWWLCDVRPLLLRRRDEAVKREARRLRRSLGYDD